jgi:DNA primase
MLYLHHPALRPELRRTLRLWEQDDFALQPHRRLWAAIAELEEERLGTGLPEAISRGLDPGESLAGLDLPRLLLDRLLADESALCDRLTPLLQPGELHRLVLAHPLLQLRGAIAVRSRQRSLRRCRHLLDAWSAQRLRTLEHCLGQLLEEEPSPAPDTDMEARIFSLFADLNADALRFQQEYYAERRHLETLDEQRRAGVDEIHAPPVDDPPAQPALPAA